MTRYRMIDSPIGPLRLAGQGPVLTHLRMMNQTYEPDSADWTLDDRAFPDVVEQLADYFAGRLQSFDVRIQLAGTPFQQSVWEALRSIPYGETRTYGEIARQIGSPTAFRAVGLANGHNPIAVIVPCHRVIGANGNLTGFGGGLDRKSTLLNLEKTTSSFTLFD
ncbi:MAG: methylated-DNA--[protein]-cysteine S-methyltransferase [Mycobacterium sp.]